MKQQKNGSGQEQQAESPREQYLRKDKQKRIGQIGHIIYYDELQRIERLLRKYNLVGWAPFFDVILSRPYNEAEIRRKAQEEIMDKFGILHGEAAVAFENYMNDPDRIKSPEAKALIEKARKLAESQGEEAVRRDERERVLKEVYDRLIPLFETVELHGHYRQILTDADISCLFAELRNKEKKEGPA